MVCGRVLDSRDVPRLVHGIGGKESLSFRVAGGGIPNPYRKDFGDRVMWGMDALRVG